MKAVVAQFGALSRTPPRSSDKTYKKLLGLPVSGPKYEPKELLNKKQEI
jgi:hypothetical protein